MFKTQELPVFSVAYWKEAGKQFANIRIMCLAAVFIALRVAVKLLTIPVGADLHIAVDFVINALGSAIYGPLVSLACGAITDTISAVFFPVGGYFFPFIFVEMAASFLFALFLWKRDITVSRLILSKFSITVICNIVMNSTVLLWMYAWLGNSKSASVIMIPRLVKNIALYPLECFLLVAFLAVALPILNRMQIYPSADKERLKMGKKHYVLMAVLLLIAVCAMLLYFFWYVPHK